MMFCRFRINDGQVSCELCGRPYPLRVGMSSDPRKHYRQCKAHGCPEPPLDMSCTHRGAVVRQVPCGCGQRGKMADVFACALHGECVLRRAKAGDGLRCCLTCKDRQAESLP